MNYQVNMTLNIFGSYKLLSLTLLIFRSNILITTPRITKQLSTTCSKEYNRCISFFSVSHLEFLKNLQIYRPLYKLSYITSASQCVEVMVYGFIIYYLKITTNILLSRIFLSAGRTSQVQAGHTKSGPELLSPGQTYKCDRRLTKSGPDL